MKKLALLLVLMPFIAFGQQEFPLIKDGGIWRQTSATINNPPDPWYMIKNQYLMEGDTIINSVVYKKIYNCDYSPSINNKLFLGGIREDSLEKVYLFIDSSQVFNTAYLQSDTEYLLYDFSLNIGDTLKVNNEVDSIQVLQSIDSVLIGNHYRKRWRYFDNSISQRDVIEGIGCTKGLFFPLQWEFENYQLLTCYEDTNIFWTNSELNGIDCFSVGIKEKHHEIHNISVYPNPNTGKLKIQLAEIPKGTTVIKLYDITGRLILDKRFLNKTNFSLDITDLQSGVYMIKMVSDNQIVYRGKIIKE